mgnify:FL=1
MAKTVLDLNKTEWNIYYPGYHYPKAEWFDSQSLRLRKQQALRIAKQASRILRNQFGARKVVLFGSVTRKDDFGPWSDIDLAAWDIPPDRFFIAIAAVTGLSGDFKIDLVDPLSCKPLLRECIEQEGVEI